MIQSGKISNKSDCEGHLIEKAADTVTKLSLSQSFPTCKAYEIGDAHQATIIKGSYWGEKGFIN